MNTFIRFVSVFCSFMFIIACAEELSSEQVRENICQAGGDAVYCDSGKRVPEVANAGDADSPSAEVAQVIDAGEPDGLDTEVQAAEPDIADTGEELPLQSDTAEATEVDTMLPDIDTALDQPEEDGDATADLDSVDIDTMLPEVDVVLEIKDSEEDKGEPTPEVVDDGEILLPDTVTPAEDVVDAEEVGEDAEVANLDANDSDVVAEPDVPQPKCLSNQGCEDGNPCTDNQCDPSQGCLSLPNNSTCTDGDVCTVDLCEQATCTTKPVVCDDGNICTSDLCTGSVGCVGIPNSATCSDLNECTVGEACAKSSCGGGKNKGCDDGNPCTQDFCDPIKGCGTNLLANGTSCGADIVCKAGFCTEFVAPPGMILIPGGKFFIGCNAKFDGECQTDELPQHELSLDAFFIDQNEVQVKAYKECVDGGACLLPATGSNCLWGSNKQSHPINCISWAKADTYCQWKGKRLPTEAEWEKSARGGCEKYDGVCAEAMPRFPWGDAPHNCSKANADACGGIPVATGSYPAGVSVYGISDLSGNVWEWTASWYLPYPFKSDSSVGTERVMKGGAYGSGTMHIRTSRRSPQAPTSEAPYLGFRCAKSVK